MKTRFTTFDLMCSVTELQRLIGMRVAQVYDIDHKTYLIKLQRTEEKCVLLLESGNRMHTTAFEWPKNVAPSGFSMKMRKHLRNKRLESMKQLGIDRVVDLQFGSGEAAYHIILELYDRGNIILTDCDLTILNVLRPHTEGEEVRFAVREKYPLDRAHQRKLLSQEEVEALLATAKPGDNIKNILNRNTEYGPSILEHILLGAGFAANCKLGKSFNVPQDIPRLLEAFQQAETLFDIAQQSTCKGYIIQKRDRRPLPDGGEEDFFTNQEFHPVVFQQHFNSPQRDFESFDAAVDEFFSTLESQKIDMKALHQEKEAMKKLENVRKDHSQRLEALERTQELDRWRAELITSNQTLVEQVVMAVRSMVASQASWPDIEEMVKAAQGQGDPVACAIHELKLSVNHVALKLSDPYAESSDDEDDSQENQEKSMIIDIDLDLTAFANARKYYDQKRNAAKKQQKTIDAQVKAFKSAEKKTKQTLKEVQAITHINKARKVFWFEKFHWFISSENYLVIGGRDPQQNELIVKRYLRAGDVYVHADIQGASSIVIKNSSGQAIPPKTLNEAGVMAMSYSVAWDAKVVTSAWWVHHDQVSKTAPTGEYLTTGAFMIRGKKNYLPPSHLIMGFSFLFKLEESSIERHKDERRVRTLEEDSISSASFTFDEMSMNSEQDQEIELEDTDEEDAEEKDNEDKKHDDVYLAEDDLSDRECSPGSANSQGSSQGGSREPSPTRSDSHSVKNDSQNTSKLEINETKSKPEEKLVEFPDVELKIQHTGSTVKFEVPTTPLLLAKDEPQGDQVIFLGDDKPVVLRSKSGQQGRNKGTGKKQNKGDSKILQHEDEMNEKNQGKQKQQQQQSQQQQQQVKRGQKGKLKKMKEKYKDQDEEDRKLMMEILKSEGIAKDAKDKGKKKGKEQGHGKGSGQKQPPERKQRPVPAPKNAISGDAGEDSEGEEERVPAAEVDMLDSLTGQPVTEDELLFAIPVVAPYSTLHNYKFKVKLTPGTGKRGKAAKTAMNMFLKDRGTSAHERDLIKSVKDEDLARNLPGKVKVSAPQLQKLKR